MKRSAKALEQARKPTRGLPPEPVPVAGGGDDLPLLGRSAAMQALFRLVARVMNSDLPVLITGENGTGKSLVARAIHDFSDRRSGPFVVAQADDLAAPEGAASLLARAGGGTLLLDEIADLTPETQARLVRMLDHAEAMGDKSPPRFLATCQTDLSARIAAGSFRQDLFYRLGGVTIPVPPLRERVEDIALLAGHFLARHGRDQGQARQLAPEALALLQAYGWPGNVRQLETLMKRLVVTGSGPEIGRAEVEAALAGQPVAMGAGGLGADEPLGASVARHLQRYFDLHGEALPPPGLHDRVLREIEVPLIEIALDATGGNQAKCADLLGINRNTLRKKLSDLDIRVTRRRKLM